MKNRGAPVKIYGLLNIRQAAGRRGGSMEYYIRDGYFALDVELPVRQGS